MTTPSRNSRPSFDASSALACLCLAFCAALPAHALPSNPPILVAQQGVEYMSGGANKDEAAFMAMVSPRWAATFEFGLKNARLPAPVRVVVHNASNGDLIMDALSSGPVMLARLELGAYDVDVTVGGLTLTQSVSVSIDVPGHAVFNWPSNFDMVAATQAAAPVTAQTLPAPAPQVTEASRTTAMLSVKH